MKQRLRFYLFFIFFIPFAKFNFGQSFTTNSDTTTLPKAVATIIKKEKSPQKIAALRSAILPGLGQVYNKKYWKLPFIYGALGTTAFVFVNNLTTYQDLRLAFKVKYNIRVRNDSTDYFKVDPNLLPLSEESIRFNRDQFRKSLDYTVLLFVAFWGLNVIDAAVDAHLKSFDISPDLSLKIKPGFSEFAGTHGINFALTIR